MPTEKICDRTTRLLSNNSSGLAPTASNHPEFKNNHPDSSDSIQQVSLSSISTFIAEAIRDPNRCSTVDTGSGGAAHTVQPDEASHEIMPSLPSKASSETTTAE
jgi:hypothetical protein